MKAHVILITVAVVVVACVIGVAALTTRSLPAEPVPKVVTPTVELEQLREQNGHLSRSLNACQQELENLRMANRRLQADVNTLSAKIGSRTPASGQQHQPTSANDRALAARVLTKPLLGMYLGEPYDDLMTRFSSDAHFTLHFAEADYPAFWKLVLPKSPVVLKQAAAIFNGRVFAIRADFLDNSAENSSAIRNELTKTYGEEGWDGFSAVLDGVPIKIEFGTDYSDASKPLVITYYHLPLLDEVNSQWKKIKSDAAAKRAGELSGQL